MRSGWENGLAGGAFSPQRIYLTHQPIGSITEYRRVLDGEPEFGAAFNALGLPSDLIDRPLPARNPLSCASCTNRWRVGILPRSSSRSAGNNGWPPFCSTCLIQG